MNYFIGQGTGVVKEFNTLEEMFAFHKTMNSLDRHFCRLYDCVLHRTIEGWRIWHADYKKSAEWHYREVSK